MLVSGSRELRYTSRHWTSNSIRPPANSQVENLAIPIDTKSKRLLLLAFGSAMLVFAALSFVWGMANTAAMQAEEKDLAELLVTLAPGDPQTHYAAALLLDGSFEPSDFERASYHYERAAALAPYNYFLWLELGRARERRGDREGGLEALRKAKELAPNYSSVRWSLGNALVRQGSVEAGFDEIIGAVEGDGKYASAAAGLAWQIAEGDVAAAKELLRRSTGALCELAVTIARDGRVDDSMAIWIELPAGEKASNLKKQGEGLLASMIETKNFRNAVRISNEIGADEKEQLIGKIVNGGFEAPVKQPSVSVFDWQIGAGQSPQIALTDGQKRSGSYSLVLIFNPADRGKIDRQLSQTIAVEPGRTYTLQFFYRAKLETNHGLRWKISSSVDGQVLASSELLMNNSEWANSKTKFRIPAGTDGVLLSLTRENCVATICPLSGEIWFDDLELIEEPQA